MKTKLPAGLDEINRKIITLLQKEPNQTQTQVAKKVGDIPISGDVPVAKIERE